MEKKVLLKDLVEFGSNVRRQFTSKVRVSDEGLYPIGELWDANTTLDMIVNGAHEQHDTIRELDQFAHQTATDLALEINRAKAAEQELDEKKADKSSVYTKDEVYNKSEVYNKEETYSKDEVYNKDEVYSKDEVYPKDDVYTKDEVDEKIGDLGIRTVGAKDEWWTIGDDTKEYASDPTYQVSTNFDYIHDEASWNESYENGGLKLYYEANPAEDLWNTVENRPANINDRAADGTYPNCIHCWQGAINAPGAKYPWIVPHFDTDVNSKLIFRYEGKDDVRPWGDRIFGNGNNHKAWGCASIPVELGEEFLLDNEGNTTFDVTKFQMILEHQDVVYHEAIPGTQEPYTVKTYVDDAIAKLSKQIADIIAEIITGEIPDNSIGTRQIEDGSILIEDLSDEIKEKLQTVVDEENENAYIG